MAPYDIIILM